jgi:hypothetical protein
MLEDEINQVWGHIEHTAEYHNFPLDILEYSIEEEQARISDYVMSEGNMNKPINPGLDDIEEDEEGPALIFTIEFK